MYDLADMQPGAQKLDEALFKCFPPNATTCSYELAWFPSWLWR
jgi:hypothetical protein